MSQKQKSESGINGTEIEPATEAGNKVDISTTFEKRLLAFEPTAFLDIRTPFGFFDYDEFYKQFVNDAQSGDTIVEIGSWVGKSTCYMGELVRFASQHGKNLRFVNIDPFIADCIITPKGYEWVENSPGMKASARAEFYKNTEPVKDFIETIEDYSVPVAERFADESLFAVWVDGHHGYESVLADMEAYWGKIRKGGVLAGHDYVIDGVHKGFEVARAVETFVNKYGLSNYRHHKSWLIYKQ